MSDIAIQIEGLSKQYKIGVAKQRHDTLRDHLMGGLGSLLRGNGRPDPIDDTIWALKDVTFEVKHGEVIGIIGRNGAGKSTLLKILSRITDPTTGHAKVYGRLASLLEVGTGFHPELTGRENIYLNGAILGMKKAEIKRKLDEIIAFAEIEKFMDTPVKRYSSGMYVRLAFAVAAHLDPEILIVDEVLAVGDAPFQKKCIGKMHDVSKEGRTVLFVSHNTAAMLNLCQRGILLSSGRVEGQGQMPEVLRQYLSQFTQGNVFQPSQGIRAGDRRATIEHFEVRPNPLQTGRSAEFTFSIHRPPSNKGDLWVSLAIGIRSEEDAPLLKLHSSDVGQEFPISQGRTEITVRLEQLPMAPGRYRVNIWMGTGQFPIDGIQDCMQLCVEPGPLVGDRYIETTDYPVVAPSIWERTI